VTTTHSLALALKARAGHKPTAGANTISSPTTHEWHWTEPVFLGNFEFDLSTATFAVRPPMPKLSAPQRKALGLAMKSADHSIYAGWNPGRATIGANTIKSLAKLGLVTLGKTTRNETWARITPAGVEAFNATS
jgi:hypothetical protein